MKNKGFTLVELVGVIVIIGVIAGIITAVITKNISDSRQKLAITQESTIIDASKSYLTDNPLDKDKTDSNGCFVTVGILRDNGYLDEDLTNPMTKKRYKASTCVSYDKTNGYAVNYINEKGPNTKGNDENTNKHNVLYNCTYNGGSECSFSGYEEFEDETVDLSPNAYKKGWTFVGWNTNKHAKTALKKKYMGKEDVTLYAIYRKEAVELTSDFEVQNTESATASADKAKCTLKAVYNNEKQATECSATVPTLSAKSGSQIIGWNTDKNAKVATLTNGGTVQLSINKETPKYYSITNYNPKQAIFTVQDEDAFENKSEIRTCTIYNLETKCTVSVPTPVGKSGYKIYGWNTDKDATDANYKGEEVITFERGTNNINFYSISRWNTELTASFNGNNSTLTGNTKQGCYLYNGNKECNVLTPTVNPPETTPDFIGWNMDSNGTTNDSAYDAKTGILKLNRDNMNNNWYAITRKKIQLTASFKYRNTSISSGTDYCEIYLYNGMKESDATDNTCSAYSSNIQKSDLLQDYDTIVGWNDDENATTNSDLSTSSGSRWDIKLSMDNKNISCNNARNACLIKWYLVTKKNAVTLTANFNGNGSTLGDSNTSRFCTLNEVYNGQIQPSGCEVEPPSVNPSNNTKNFVGFNTNSNAKVNDDAYNINDNKLSLNTSNSGHTWYAITKGESLTLKANFEVQSNTGVTASKTGEYSCTIDAPYNGASRGTTCTLTTPTLTAKDNYTALGWNKDKTAKEATVGSGEDITLSSDLSTPTYYSIFYKTLGANFYPNGSVLSDANDTGVAHRECYAYNGSDTCDITDLPTITRDGFNIVGYNRDKTQDTSEYKVNETLHLSSNIELYAITKKEITAIFTKEIDKIDKLDDSTSEAINKTCTIVNTAESCSITTPSITPKKDYSDESIWHWCFKNTMTEDYIEKNTKIELSNNANFVATGIDVAIPKITFNPTGYKYNEKWFATNTDLIDANMPYILVNISDAGVGVNEKQDIYYGFNNSSTSYSGTWNLLDSSLITYSDKSISAKIPTNSLTAGRYYLWIKKGISDSAGNIIDKDTVSDGEYDFDNNKPIINSINSSSSTNSITVVPSVSSYSGISKYEYSLDGTNFVSGDENYTFTNLVLNTNYNVYVRITNKAGLVSDTVKVAVKTKALSDVSISLEKDSDTHTTATINYPDGCGSTLSCKYIKDNKETVVTSKEVIVEFDTYGTLVAEAIDKVNNVSTSKSVTITLPITGLDASLSNTEYIYDGSIKMPTVTVKNGSDILDSSLYSVSYLDSASYNKYISNGSLTGINSVSPVDVGTYYVVIAGSTYYDGYINKTLSYTIDKADGFIVFNKDSETIQNDVKTTSFIINKYHGGSLSVKTNNSLVNTSISDKTITVSGLDNLDPGKSVTIIVTSAMTDNYNEASASYVITKSKKDNNITLDTKEVAYTGEKQSTTARSDSNEDVSLKYYSDDKCQVESDPINAGVYYATGSTKETDTYKKGSLECTKAITISKAKPDVKLSSNNDEVTVGNTMNVLLNTVVSGNVSIETISNDYVSGSINGNSLSITGKQVGTSVVKILFSPSDINNYSNITMDYTITVEAKTVNIKFEKGNGTESIEGTDNKTCIFKSLDETCTVETPSIKAKTGYTPLGFSASETGDTFIKEGSNIELGITSPVVYYGISEANSYNIKYNLNGGTNGDNAPTTGNYENKVTIDNPTKNFIINIDNKDEATLSSDNVSKNQEFTGWTGSNLYESALTGSGDNLDTWDGSKTLNKYFKNLRNDSGTALMTANWKSIDITLPSVHKDGYSCSFKDDAGVIYSSSGTYTPSVNTGNTTLHTYCVSNTATISIYKDNSLWQDSNVKAALYKDNNLAYDLTIMNGYAKASNIIVGTYDIYASSYSDSNEMVDTGVDITVNSTGTATINYYTLTLNKDDNITEVSGEGVYLSDYVVNINANASSGYTFSQWMVEKGNSPDSLFNNTSKITLNESTTLKAISTDGKGPKCFITSTSLLKQTKQTLTLACSDDDGVASYYFGTEQNDIKDTSYVSLEGDKSFEKTLEQASSGTYYLYAKDKKGNVSEAASLTLYKYIVENKIMGSFDVVSSESYIAPSNTEIDITQVYKQPSDTSFSYYTVGDTEIMHADDKHILTSDITFKVWFVKSS